MKAPTAFIPFPGRRKYSKNEERRRVSSPENDNGLIGQTKDYEKKA